jgi:hypothetical protein
VARRNRKEARVGQPNYGWCKLSKHPDKKALDWDGELQVDALVRDAWGDVGHLTVMVRRERLSETS